LARTIRIKIDVTDFEDHELAAAREGLISHAKHRALSVRAQALAGAVDELFDLFPGA
jgi:hypothetical protein